MPVGVWLARGSGQVERLVTRLVGVMTNVWMIRTGEAGAHLPWDGALIATLR